MTRESVLITGSGRGLGKDLALVFAENSYDLILNGRDNLNLRRVLEEVSHLGIEVYCVEGDIRKIETMDRLTEEARRRDISVLINNAGAPTWSKPFEEIGYSEIEETIMTNLISPIELTRRIYPLLQKKGSGTIININSIIGLEPKKNKSEGVAARYGLGGFTDSLRLEAEEHGINVIGVHPTKIKTRPEYEHGWEIMEVAEKIYRAYADGFSGRLVLDGRSEEFKQKVNIEQWEIKKS